MTGRLLRGQSEGYEQSDNVLELKAHTSVKILLAGPLRYPMCSRDCTVCERTPSMWMSSLSGAKAADPAVERTSVLTDRHAGNVLLQAYSTYSHRLLFKLLSIVGYRFKSQGRTCCGHSAKDACRIAAMLRTIKLSRSAKTISGILLEHVQQHNMIGDKEFRQHEGNVHFT